VSVQPEPLCTCTPQPFVAVQFVVSERLASRPLALPAPAITEPLMMIVTEPLKPVLLRSVKLASVTPVVTSERIPQATRPPDLLWMMKGFPEMSVALLVTSKLKVALPVLLEEE